MEFPVLNKIAGRVTVQVSDEDADLADVRWHLAGGKPQPGEPGWYVNGAPGYLHRIVAHRMGLITEVRGNKGGKWTESIDHANGDKLDNRRENLRLRDRKQQMSNTADRLQRNNSSGHRGVSYIQESRSWYAHVMVDRKTVPLGHFATKEEAIAARQAWDEGHWVKPPEKALRANNTSGYRGASFSARRPRRPWIARATVGGKVHHLGDFATKEEAVAARRAWDEAHR